MWLYSVSYKLSLGLVCVEELGRCVTRKTVSPVFSSFSWELQFLRVLTIQVSTHCESDHCDPFVEPFVD